MPSLPPLHAGDLVLLTSERHPWVTQDMAKLLGTVQRVKRVTAVTFRISAMPDVIWDRKSDIAAYRGQERPLDVSSDSELRAFVGL